MSRQNTISQMDLKVKEGLEIARSKVEADTTLCTMIDLMLAQWEQAAGNLIILASQFSAFRYRDEESTRRMLQECMKLYQSHASGVLAPEPTGLVC
jgi:hypothetical protein